jgi:hypothetical protein
MRVVALAVLVAPAVPAIGSAQTAEWIRQFGSTGQDRALAICVERDRLIRGGGTEAGL